MAKVHPVTKNGTWSTENHICQHTVGKYNPILSIKIGNTNIKTKISENEVKNVSNDDTNISDSDDNDSLEFEKTQHRQKADLRMELFKKILCNEEVESNVTKFCVSIVVCILVTSASSFAFTLIPVHNLMLYPSYWYEFIFQGITWCIWIGIFYTYVNGYYLNIEYIKGIRHTVVFFLAMIMSAVLVFICVYFIWTCALHFCFPMPFLGHAVYFSINFVAIILFWLRFPIGWKKNSRFRRRLKFWTLGISYAILIPVQYQLASILIIKYQNEYQPVFALLFDVLRELNSWVVSKIISQTATGDESEAQLVVSCSVGIGHTVLICYFLGSSATLGTSLLLIGLDFFINIYLSLQIVWITKRRPENIEKHIDLLQELARNELIEFVTPLSFLIVFVLAYYGPNSELIGDVGATIWHFEEVNNINESISIILLFFSLDLCSTVVSSIILWGFCKISLFKACTALQAEYGKVVGALLGIFLFTVSRMRAFKNDLNC
jgi:hypothetical protein